MGFSHYRLPVGYFFTNALAGPALHKMTMKVMESVEETGLMVIRIVADNHATNRKLFSILYDGPILHVVKHVNILLLKLPLYIRRCVSP